MASWWFWCVLCLPSPWQLGSVPGPGSPSQVTWPGSGLSLVRVSLGTASDWSLPSQHGRRCSEEGVRCEQFIFAEDRNIFSAVCDALLHLLSSPDHHMWCQREAKDPTQRRISSNHRDEKRKRVIKCFPSSCQTFSVWNLSWFHVRWKKVKIKTFTLDMSIHHQLFHKLWS